MVSALCSPAQNEPRVASEWKWMGVVEPHAGSALLLLLVSTRGRVVKERAHLRGRAKRGGVSPSTARGLESGPARYTEELHSQELAVVAYGTCSRTAPPAGCQETTK